MVNQQAIIIFCLFVAVVLGISFYFGAKAKSAKGYYAAHGQIHWFINGIAFAGDYLSAASFLGICGMIAMFGYDGFLYSIGYLAGWVVALFVVAEPLKRMGRFTFADALDNKFNSQGIKLTAAISTLVVSIFYLIPQMVGAGALIKPLLGFSHQTGVLIVGVVVILIVTTAGMVSTTYVQFIKGSLLVIFCAVLVAMILQRGLTTHPEFAGNKYHHFKVIEVADLDKHIEKDHKRLPDDEAWKNYVRVADSDGRLKALWRKQDNTLTEAQFTTVLADGNKWVNGVADGTLLPVGHIRSLPGNVEKTGPLGPGEFLSTLQNSVITQWDVEKIKDADGSETTVNFQRATPGKSLMSAGYSPTFKGVQTAKPPSELSRTELFAKIDFLSLMLALFCGTASLPHILIRYYTVKDQAAVRKSTVVGIASIGFFYVLTLFLGLGAMTSGTLNVADPQGNMAAPLLAKSFGDFPFAVISAIAFTTVLGTVSGLIMAASGAVAHDLMTNFLKIDMDDHAKVRAGKIAAVFVGLIAMVLGIIFEKMNVSFLVGWAFNVAASANLPALVMLLFWKRTTKQGITCAIVAGMVTSLGWILLSGATYKSVYGLNPADAIVPFSQPGIVTIPLGFIVLIIVSLMTQRTGTAEAVSNAAQRPAT
jgi:cation/acetate symporter